MRIRPWLPFAGTSAALLGWSGAVVPRLPPVAAVRATANVVATAVLLGVARRSGVRWGEVWGGRAAAGPGARAGGTALAGGAAGYATLLALPAGRRLLAGTGAELLTPGAVALRAGLLIPVGTVLCEEVAFRGVLQALAPRSPVVATSAVFGLWHVGSARHPLGPQVPAPVGGVVAATALAGLLLGALRRRTGSLLAPAGLHLAANSLGLVAAALAGRVTARPRRAPAAADRRRPPARPPGRRRRRR